MCRCVVEKGDTPHMEEALAQCMFAAVKKKIATNFVSYKPQNFVEKLKMPIDLESGENTFFVSSCGGQEIQVCLDYFCEGPILHHLNCKVNKSQILQPWSPWWCYSGKRDGVF